MTCCEFITVLWGTRALGSLKIGEVAASLLCSSALRAVSLVLQELNAPSRRRGKRLPDTFTTPPLSPPLGIERLLASGSAKKAPLERKSDAAVTPLSVAVLATGGAGKDAARARNPGAA